MNTGKSRYGADEEVTVIAVNPRKNVLGDKTDLITDALVGTDLTVYRVDYFDDADSLGDHHEMESRVQDETCEPGYPEPWYDDAFILGRDGLDEVDCRKILRKGSNFEFLGGMFSDIGSVRESIDEVADEVSYVLNHDLIFDYIVWPRNIAGYEEEELGSLRTLLEEDRDQTEERLSQNELGSENVRF